MAGGRYASIGQGRAKSIMFTVYEDQLDLIDSLVEDDPAAASRSDVMRQALAYWIEACVSQGPDGPELRSPEEAGAARSALRGPDPRMRARLLERRDEEFEGDWLDELRGAQPRKGW